MGEDNTQEIIELSGSLKQRDSRLNVPSLFEQQRGQPLERFYLVGGKTWWAWDNRNSRNSGWY